MRLELDPDWGNLLGINSKLASNNNHAAVISLELFNRKFYFLGENLGLTLTATK